MARASELLFDLRRRGIRIWNEGSRVHHAAPEGYLDDRILHQLRESREEILLHLLQSNPGEDVSLPLSRTQKRFQVGTGDGRTNPGDHVRMIHRLRGPLDLVALESAFQELLVRHPCLRTCFVSDGTTVLQQTNPPYRFRFDHHSMRGEPREGIDARIDEFIAKPFDVKTGRMIRAMIIDVDADDRFLVVVSHHLVIDGWSSALMLEELTNLHAMFSSGRSRESSPKIGSFSDYARSMEEWEGSDGCREHLAEWRKDIETGLVATVLPADHSRHESRIASFGEASSTVEGELVADLAARTREWRIGHLEIVNAATSCLIARAAGVDRATTGLASTNRSRAEYERVIGNFANESVIHVGVDHGHPFSDVLEDMKASIRRANHRLNTPFDTVIESLAMKRVGKRRLAMPIFFSLYDLTREGTLRIDGVSVERIPDSHVNTFQEIGIRVVIEADSIRFKVEYDETLFRHERIEAFLANLILVLKAVLDDPSTTVSQLPFDPALAEGVEEDPVLSSNTDKRHVEPGSMLETRLAEIWTELLGVHPVGRFDDFFALGGSSFLAIRLIDRVHQVFGAQLGIDALMSGPTLKELASRIEKSGKRLQIDRSVWICRDHDQTRVFCLPGIGGLAAFTYRNIAGFLEGAASLVGLQMRGLDGLEQPDDRVETMAATMLDEIQRIQPTGPYHLCGYSFGGNIAIEIARLIQDSDEEIASLLLLDTYPPNFIKFHRRILRKVRKRITSIRQSNKPARRDEFDPVLPENDPTLAALARVGGLGNSISNTIAITRAAAANYKPQKYTGDVDLVTSASNNDAQSTSDNRLVGEWKKLVDGALNVHAVPVPHLDLVREGSEQLAEIIKSVLAGNGRRD